MKGRFLFLPLIIFCIIGCNLSNNTIPPQPTFTLVLDNETLTPAIEMTPTFQTVTATSFPALVFEERKRNLIDLFSTNRNCSFPCWWGVNLGDSIEKVKGLSPVLGKQIIFESSSMYSYTVSLEKLNTPDVYVQFFMNNNQSVDQIDVFLEKPSRFRDYYDVFEKNLSLLGVLNKYGEPDEVLLQIMPRIEKDIPIGYGLVLVYEDNGFSVQYTGIIDLEDPIKICSLGITDFHIQVFELRFANSAIIEDTAKGLASLGYRPIDEVTLLSKDDFFLLFSKSENTECIEPQDSK